MTRRWVPEFRAKFRRPVAAPLGPGLGPGFLLGPWGLWGFRLFVVLEV